MAGLDTYRAKRNFNITAEPRGQVARSKAKALRFVIQRHAASRLHYDFRLELSGVLKSWAVTKVPALDPATKRLAVEVEDHPLEYGSFEGTIPQGQYGGGTVQLWDEGTWFPESDDPESDLRKGHLKFRIDGKRLHGGWALIRMRDDRAKRSRNTRHNWLLVKEKDDDARPGEPDALLAEDTSVSTGRTLEEIAASKKSRVWNSNRNGENGGEEKQAEPLRKKRPPEPRKSTGAKAKRVKIPEFVEPQLTPLVDEPPVGAAWVHEIKFDGYRMQLRVEKGRSVLRTRKALDWTHRFPEIAAEGRHLPDCLIDGEICALDQNGLPSFAGLQQALSDGKTANLVFFVFDLLFLNGVDLREQPLSARKDLLADLIEKTDGLPRFRYVEHFATSGAQFLKTACEAKLEGIISKRLDAPYRSGRSDLWTKEKCRGGQEVVIGGWWGGPAKLRSLLIGSFEGGDFVYRGRIGTGFNSENSGPTLRALNRAKRAKSPFTKGVKPPRAKEITWVEPTLVAEVEYATITQDGLLRQASFKALREDKPARSVSLEQPTNVHKAEERSEDEVPTKESKNPIAKAVPNTAKVRTSNSTGAVAGITLSNPGKVLWPSSGKGPEVTKLDLARYYEMAAERMLPHIANRPISLVRAPEGINGEKFFQRHVLAGVAHALAISVAGEKKPFHGIDSVEGLVALAQAAVLEIHPWGCKPGDPETPERLIFDLDPAPDVTFDRVIESAKEMRDVLAAIGFTPFVKTTGGKGIHVVVAIEGTRAKPINWDEAKAFSLKVVELMAAAAPDRYLTNMSKKQREGKIFLDYLRNGRSATAVGPWSPRAREGATIAVPVTWNQLKKDFDPSQYTLPNAAPLLKRADPWKDLAKSAYALEAARKKLDKL